MTSTGDTSKSAGDDQAGAGRSPASGANPPELAIRETTQELPEYVPGQARPPGPGSAGSSTGFSDPAGATDPDGASIEKSVTGRQPRGRGCLGPGCLLVLVGTVVALVGLAVGARAIGFWPHLSNPFAEQQTDRTQPPLLKSIQDLSRYTAAQGNFQVVVDLENDRKYVPDFLLSHRTLFVGVGSVEAYVDFSTIAQGAVVESSDGTTVEIRLPAPQLGEVNLDIGNSYVFAERRGLFNRVKDAFSGDPNRQRETYQRAEEEIAQVARDTELRQRAQENTRKMLEGLLHSLGYQSVTITFAAP